MMCRALWSLKLLGVLVVACHASKTYEAELSNAAVRALEEPNEATNNAATEQAKCSGVVGANSETDGAPGMPARKSFKFHTVNPAQMAKEDRLFKKHADNMKREYQKLIKGGNDDESEKQVKPEDRVSDAKEKADKAMAAARLKAKEKSKKELLKTKERLKKEEDVKRQKAKEKMKKKMRAFTPLKGGPIQQAAMARYDAYRKQMLAAHLQAKAAKKEMSKEEVDRVDELAAQALKRAQYLEASAIKHAIKKEQRKATLRKERLRAQKVMDKADAKVESDEKANKDSPDTWECTEDSCKAKCKTQHCLQWCSRCVTLKSEKLKFDPISDKMVVVGYKSHQVSHSVEDHAEFVDEETSKLHDAELRQKEADRWVDRKLGIKHEKEEDRDKEAVKQITEARKTIKQGGNHAEGSRDTSGQKTSGKKSASPADQDSLTISSSTKPSTKASIAILEGTGGRGELSESKEGERESKQSKHDRHPVLHWAEGVKKPSSEKQIAAEVHIKIRERLAGMVHAGNKHGDGFLENQPSADLKKKGNQ